MGWTSKSPNRTRVCESPENARAAKLIWMVNESNVAITGYGIEGISSGKLAGKIASSGFSCGEFSKDTSCLNRRLKWDGWFCVPGETHRRNERPNTTRRNMRYLSFDNTFSSRKLRMSSSCSIKHAVWILLYTNIRSIQAHLVHPKSDRYPHLSLTESLWTRTEPVYGVFPLGCRTVLGSTKEGLRVDPCLFSNQYFHVTYTIIMYRWSVHQDLIHLVSSISKKPITPYTWHLS